MSVFGYPTENTNGTYKHANTTAELDMGLATSAKQWVDSEDIRRETDTRLTVSNEYGCIDETTQTGLVCKADKPNKDLRTLDDSNAMSMKGAHKHNTEQDKEPPMNEISAKTIKENLQKSTGQDKISVLSHVHVKTFGRPLYAKLEDDEFASKIVGICVTKKGFILLADLNNNKLKIFSPRYVQISAVTIPHGPLSVAELDDNCGLVSRNDKTINVIDISNPEAISVTDILNLDYKIMAITACRGNIVVTTLQRKGAGCVKMLKRNGDEIWSVTTDIHGNKMFEAPEYIASIGIEKHSVVVSDYRKERLIFMSGKDGSIFNIINIPGTGPEGVTVDDYNNLLVASYDRNEVWFISNDHKKVVRLNVGKGKTTKEIQGEGINLRKIFAWREQNRRECPQSVAYNSVTKELVVSFNPSDFVERFKISW